MIKYKGVSWRNYHYALIPATPPHIEINLNEAEAKELLKISGAYFVRWASKWDIKQKTEFWYIIKDVEENLEQYSSNKRRQIRKGLKNCIVKKVDNTTIANDGYEVYKSAFLSYKKNYLPLLSYEEFKKNILNATKCDFWAVYEREGGKMIAYSQNIIDDNSVTYSTIKFHPDYLKLYSSNALFFKMNEYYLNEKKYRYVSDGARSISHDTNIQEYLEYKFNFRKAYCKLHVVYRWDIKIVVNMLYPFRNLIYKLNNKLNNKIYHKLAVLLKQEEIRKSCASI